LIRRKTIQCALVLDAVNELKSHPTADEVYDFIRKKHPTVSRTTVYRNLARLCETGDIRKVEVPGSADRFDHLPKGHYHVKCTVCGRVADVDMDYITDMENGIRNSRGYEITGYEMIFKGVCPDCGSRCRGRTEPEKKPTA
jgi:Fe2+ or Zn2+ uptake regulation protein